MENKTTNILDSQIEETEELIVKNKITIAELFIKIHNSNLFSSNNKNLDNLDVFDDMDKMPKYLKELSDNESKLKTLIEIKSKITNSELTELVI